MEASPLTQQSRPDTFKPKIVQLYEDLFQVRHNPIFILTQFRKKKKRKRKIILIYHLQTSDSEPSEGFWREFFLLTPDRDQLHAVLERLSPDTTLSLQVLNPFHSWTLVRFERHANFWQQVQTQQLFARAIREAASGVSPANVFALEVSSGTDCPQTAFLIFSKKSCLDLVGFSGMRFEKKVYKSQFRYHHRARGTRWSRPCHLGFCRHVGWHYPQW